MFAPKFSIVLPVYEWSDAVKAAVDSVLKQTYSQFELIIVGHGSHDISDEVCKLYNEHLKSGKIALHYLSYSASTSRAIARGLLSAKNTWIAYARAGAVMKPWFLSVFAGHAAKSPNARVLYAESSIPRQLEDCMLSLVHRKDIIDVKSMLEPMQNDLLGTLSSMHMRKNGDGVQRFKLDVVSMMCAQDACCLNADAQASEQRREKVIVSMTSWKRRIQNVKHVILQMLSGTVVPDKIVLNLASDEFMNRELDLPDDLNELLESSPACELHWVQQNTKPHKKIIHTLNRFPDDIVISIDDDIEYPPDFIEMLLKHYNDYGRQCPVTCGSYKWENGIYAHHGAFSLMKREFVGDFYDELYNDLVLKDLDGIPFADPVITYAVLLNGRRYCYAAKPVDMTAARKRTHSNDDALSKLGTREYKRSIQREHQLIRQHIKAKYGLEYDDLMRAPVVVNCTTYPARDRFLHEALVSVKNQSMQASKVILILSEEEYPGALPDALHRCIDDGLVTGVCWVKKNTYTHKRYALAEQNAGSYNVFVDDDIRYSHDFIESVVTCAQHDQSSVVNYASKSVTYEGMSIKRHQPFEKKSHHNSYMAGLACIPPYALPVFFLHDRRLLLLRDKYVKKCDESWIKPILYKYDIPVLAVHEWSECKLDVISGSQQSALYKCNKQTIDGINVREKERNLFNAVKILDAEAETLALFPKLSIRSWKLMP